MGTYSNFKSDGRGIGTVPSVAEILEQNPDIWEQIGEIFGGMPTERRQPVTQPVYTPPKWKSLNKPARVNGWEQNRLEYQKLRDRDTKCTTPGIDLSKYEIVSYSAGDHQMKANGLAFDHFDHVSLITESTHPKTGVHRFHFAGTRDQVVTLMNCIKRKK
jgi:hypothetical protein